MSKYVLIPDSFKGTLSSLEVCRIVAEEIRAQEPDAEICAIPVADGGEGTVDAFLAAVGGQRVRVACHGPYGELLSAEYGLLPDGTAVVEMAAAAGLPLVGERRNAERTTTYGVGELICHAARHGAQRIVLALGGSATNDGGCGAAAAAGVRFLDENGAAFVPVGATLKDIAHIDLTGLDEAVRCIPFTTMCDIDNPLCGPAGASAVFGPQKGADPAMVRRLDAGLRHLAEVLLRCTGRDVLTLPGGGAAGGFGAGAAVFFNSPLRMGIEAVLELTDFDAKAADADLIITGEGRLDSQSLRGKVVVGVARRAKALGVSAAALVGGSETDIGPAYEQGLCGVFPIHPAPGALEEVKPLSREHLRFTAANLIRFYRAVRQKSLPAQ